MHGVRHFWFFEPHIDPSVYHIRHSGETPANQENMPLNVILFNSTKSLPLQEVKLTTETLKVCCLCILQEWLQLNVLAYWLHHLDTVVAPSSTM